MVMAAALACAGCKVAPAPTPLTLSFQPDEVANGSEEYLCFDFDATPFAGNAVDRVAWTAPSGGGVTLHHAILWAMQSPFPAGPLSCRWMPADAVGLHIWAPGDEPLAMPEGFALAIPAKTTKLVIQAHVLRSSTAPAQAASVTLDLAEAPAHLAAWHSIAAKVPPIQPYSSASATAQCRARAAVQTLFVWPHMHALGKTFHGAIERANGSSTPIIDLVQWEVAGERTYPVELAIAAGDVITATCTWDNPTPSVVVGGLWTTDEMCTESLIWWPAEAPYCDPL
jgi:hypothetical protein